MLDFTKNYFDLFGLSVGYTLDRNALSERYRDLQRVLHPDRFASASEQQRRLSMQGATRVNEAYAVLRDPLKRAIYLLELKSFDMAADNQTAQDTMFLIEQMEMRERLEALRNSKAPEDELAQLIDKLNTRIRELTARLAVLFDNYGDTDLPEAADTVRKMQFMEKLRLNAEEFEADLEAALD